MRSALPAALFVLAAPGVAQTPVAPPASPPGQAAIHFPHALEKLAAGEPVPLVAVSLGRAMGRPQRCPDVTGKPLKVALSIIADTYSDHLPENPRPTQIERWNQDHESLQPYQLGPIWTLARNQQWEFAKNPNVPDVLNATSPSVLLKRLVDSLTDEQLRKATTVGLALDDLTKRQQPVFRAAFQRPILLFTLHAPASRGAAPSRTVHFDGILPIEQCAIRLNLSFPDFHLLPKESKAGQVIPSWAMENDGSFTNFPEFPTAPNGYTFPLLNHVPVKLKPGDLDFDAAALDARIGVDGTMRLDAGVEAAAKATGLALRVDPRFTGPNVAFIGDRSLRSGDVLRAFAFDVQGAWRRVGDAIILTFDRTPLAATRMTWEEQMATLDKSRDELLETQLSHRVDDHGDRLLRLLQSDPDGPPGPNPEQVKRMLEPDSSSRLGLPRSGTLTFAELTPDQQEAVRLRMLANSVSQYTPDVNDPEIQALLPQASANEINVRMTIEAPGMGRYKVQTFYSDIYPSSISLIRQLGATRPEEKTAEPDTPIVLPAKTRALAVPPLSRSDWPRLFRQMRRKGLDTLYLPVLWDGYTLHPSKQFPLLPLARQRDMLAEVLALARVEGIDVVGLIHTLAWRHPGGSNSHWLRKYPNLIERDVTGRGRRDWTMANLEYLAAHQNYDFGRMFREDSFIFSDLVSPTDPSVKRRLEGLLDELKAYQGLTGVAFAEWSRLSYRHYMGEGPGLDVGGPPILGYGVPQRAAFIKEHSIDPADFESQGAGRIDVPTFALREDQRVLDNAWAKVRLTEDGDLLKGLKVAAGKTWPGRVHIFSPLEFSGQEERDAIPTGNVNIRMWTASYADPASWVQVGPPPDLLGDAIDTGYDGGPDRVTELANQLRRRADSLARAKRESLPGMVLDFRAAPSLLWDGLARLANSPTTGETEK